MRIRWNQCLALCAALAMIGYLSACGKVAEEASEAAIEAGAPEGSNVEIDSDKGEIAFQQSDGQGGTASIQAGESVSLPEDFPEDIPIPEGVTWNLVQNTKSDGKSGVTVQGMVDTSVADTAAYMKKELAGHGWKSEQSLQQGGQMEMLTYKKGERMLHITLSQADGKTAIVLASK